MSRLKVLSKRFAYLAGYPEWAEDLANMDKQLDEHADLTAALRECVEAEKAWKEYYEKELAGCDAEIKKYQDEGDGYGVNFHQGRRSGIIQHDIGLGKFKDALTHAHKLLESKP